MGVRLAGALDLGAARHGAEGPVGWTCALVNNMPDAAFGATERQFMGLLAAGSGCETVLLTRHTMVGVPRGERIRARIAAEYRPLDDITSDPPDLLVVTGSNPIESRIEDEPYWSDLHGLLKWGSENVPAMVLSCLSAPPAGQMHGRLRPAGQPDPPADRRVLRFRRPAPLTAQRRARRGGGRRRLRGGPALAGGGVERGDENGGPFGGGAGAGPPRVRPLEPRARVPPGRATLRRPRARRITLPPKGLRDRSRLGPAPPPARAGGRRRAGPGPGGRLPVRRGQYPRPLAVAGGGPASLCQPVGHHPEEERLRPCTTRPSPSTVATHPTGRGPWPCPSTRRGPTTSSTPPTPVPCSTWRRPASTTTGSTTRPATSSSSASAPSKVGRRPWWWLRAWPPLATPS